MTPQNVKEFWNVCTRPADNNGMGLSVAAAERHTQFLERHFTLLPDSAATYQEWRALLVTYEISGKQVHDAYLVAAMKAHGVTQILTFDVKDFALQERGYRSDAPGRGISVRPLLTEIAWLRFGV